MITSTLSAIHRCQVSAWQRWQHSLLATCTRSTSSMSHVCSGSFHSVMNRLQHEIHNTHVRRAHAFEEKRQPSEANPDQSFDDERGKDAKWLISQLLQHFNKTSEVRQYIKYFGSAGEEKFAIIRVSGDVLHDRGLLDSTASALAFLHRVGLRPIVVHGVYGI